MSPKAKILIVLFGMLVCTASIAYRAGFKNGEKAWERGVRAQMEKALGQKIKWINNP